MVPGVQAEDCLFIEEQQFLGITVVGEDSFEEKPT